MKPGYYGSVRKGALVIEKNENLHFSHHICIINAFINHSKPRLLVMFSPVLDSNKYFGFCGLNPELMIEWGCPQAPARHQRLVYYTFIYSVCKKMIGTLQSWSGPDHEHT